MLNIAQSTRARYPNLCQALAPEPETFVQYMARKGIKDPTPRPASYYHSRVRMQACPHKYPDETLMRHFVMIGKQSPLFVGYYDDDGVSGFVYSERTITDMYVAEFCRLNHLKG